jgi:phosphoribosylaminoimidazole carboxylase (NCAIR synthetase)
LQKSNVAVHLYGKPVAAAKRKMGHLTALSNQSVQEAQRWALEAREKLKWV